jgi:pimeloyl-ACP methyl ester carboxylesterase
VSARRWGWLLGALALGALSATAFGLLMRHKRPPPPAPPAAVAAAPAAPERAPTPTAELEETPCWFPLPPGRAARCGVLAVPERRRAERSRLLHLRFVVFRGDKAEALDPIIYLNGGPGEPAAIDAAAIDRWWEWRDRTGWAKSRDLVVFDYRGVGLSEPAMQCHELAETAYRVFAEPLDSEQVRDAWSSAARRCAERLGTAGVDLAGYNTAAIAEDLHSLVGQLGYRSWDILAVSYGTRVALSFVDRWPAGTRAVVLDSVYPRGIAAYVDGGRAAAAAFAGVFKECAEDRACDAAYPRLAAVFDDVLQRAAASPLAVRLADPRGGPAIAARLDDGKLVDVLLYAFYDWRDIDRLPAIIAALGQGDTHPLEGLATAALGTDVSPRTSQGLFFSVECHDEFPENPPAAVEQAAAALPRFRNFMLSGLPLAVCPVWPVGPIAAEPPAVDGGDVPILMLSGALDALTPPEWAKRAAETRRNAVQIEFRGVGHGVLEAHGCASIIVERFLSDPTRPPVDNCLLAVGPPQFQ